MKYIIANWKSHKSRDEVVKWMDVFEQSTTSTSVSSVLATNKVIIAPSFPSLMFVSNRLLNPELKSVSLATQDLSPFPSGAYTGAVSSRNVDGFGVTFAILGHSERRRHFHETHQEVANKVDQCLSASITPIVCVDDEYIAAQAAAISPENRAKCLVAYEDLAAIGTGQTTPLDQVKQQFSLIESAFGPVPKIYGGSVNPQNAAQYLAESDGVLVGTASLAVSDFMGIITSYPLK